MIPGCCAVPLLNVSVYALGVPKCRHIRDGVSLSAACGTIGEHSGIVAVEDAVQEVLCGGFVDFGLGCVVVKDAIECERLVLGSLSSHAWSHASLCG